MPPRRTFLKQAAGGIASLSLLPKLAGGAGTEGEVVNDVHSQINRTRVRRILRPNSIKALGGAIADAAARGRAVSLSGSRHSMGGQQFATDTTLLDLRSLNRVIRLDRENALIEVEAGITWPPLVQWLNQHAPELSIIQKQTGGDEMTIGGALSSNIHGRGLTRAPIIADVEAFTLIDAQGESVECSRETNAELFALAIGGYGLFGVIATVQLRLTRRVAVQRTVEVLPVDQLMPAIGQRIREGYTFGDLQYMTDENADGFLRTGVFSCYRPTSAQPAVEGPSRELSRDDWQSLYQLAHENKARAYEAYRDYYLQTDGQVYWSDTHQLSIYLEDQNKQLNRSLGRSTPSSLMITELYVPRDQLTRFMEKARAAALEQAMDIIYGTIRFIETDEESFLAWAKAPLACIIFNLHIHHSRAGLEKAEADFRRLIDEALALGGSYYLTYHRWARKDQVLAAYPQFPEFLRRKRHYDPEERFTSDWYRHYRQLFGS